MKTKKLGHLLADLKMPGVESFAEGVKTLFAEFNMKSGADISICGRYRYSLTREWDSKKPSVLFIMLNPSKADALKDDPTVTRCIGFAKDWGYGKLVIANLFAYRETNPLMLLHIDDPLGRDNMSYLSSAMRQADLIVCAWGNPSLVKLFGAEKQFKLILSQPKPLHYLGLTTDGTPRHPLYLPKSLTPILFEHGKTRV